MKQCVSTDGKCKIIILGANGQLGSDLVKICTAIGLDFLAVTSKDFNVLTDDIKEKIMLLQGNYIINCIALTNVDGCEIDTASAFNINAVFAYHLAKFCQEQSITLFHISTDYIFDGTKLQAYTETDMPNPLNIYGLSKYAGELAVANYAFKYFIFRVSSLFGKAGASGKGGNFITTMQRLALQKESFTVIADQITCPTATLIIARAIISFITNRVTQYGIYNCVSANSCSWYEFAQEIIRLSGLDVCKIKKASFATYPFKAKRPQYAVMAIEKISQYYQMPTWQESLVEYFKG